MQSEPCQYHYNVMAHCSSHISIMCILDWEKQSKVGLSLPCTFQMGNQVSDLIGLYRLSAVQYEVEVEVSSMFVYVSK